MKTNSRFLGKIGERAFCSFLRKYQGVTVRRTKQHDTADSPDIESSVKCRGHEVVWEVTTSKACRIGTDYLHAKSNQADLAAANMLVFPRDMNRVLEPLVAWRDYGRGWRISFWAEGMLVTADAHEWMQAQGYVLKGKS